MVAHFLHLSPLAGIVLTIRVRGYCAHHVFRIRGPESPSPQPSPRKSGATERTSNCKDLTPMQYRNLGRSGLKISPICLGTMMFGGPTDEATSTRIVARAREAGINFIDTADAYNGGNSGQVVGRAISNNRPGWILATKLANPMGDDPNRGGLSRRWVLQAADESLKRLGTHYIHLYYFRTQDPST